MKDDKTVIREFNDVVNMTVSELESWLKSSDSKNVGWSKDDGCAESVGHDSGRRIIEILKSNPQKDSKKYSDEDIQHMRKAVSYCKRHLAQEEQANNAKSDAEVKKTKSYASLKNWGHDPLKKLKSEGKDDGVGKQEQTEIKGKGKGGGDGDDEGPQTGEKRKRAADGIQASKKQESSKGTEHSKDNSGRKEQENQNTQSSKGPKPGETVSWNWGEGQPKGKVLEVKPQATSITTKNGNKVSREGNAQDPAVVLDTGKSKAIKLSHELNG